MYNNVYTAIVLKIGDMGIIRFGATLKNSIAGTGITICTVAEGFRPWSNQSAIAVGTYSGVSYPLMAPIGINTNGKVVTSFGSGTLSGAIWVITSIYTLKEHNI